MKTFVAALLTSVMLIAACTPTSTGPTPTGSGSAAPVDPRQTILTIGVSQEPSSFDPHVNVAAVSAYRYYPNVYESLIQYGTDGSLQPGLADSWTLSSDSKTYRFKLKSGVKFSDGAPFNAAAVKFGVDRLNQINKGAIALFSPIASVQPIDDLTVDIVLKQPYAPILAVLAGWQGAIFVSPQTVKDHEGTDNAQAWMKDHTAGTGPFMLDSWRPNDRIVFVRNPNYRQPAAADSIQRIIEPLIAEPATLRQQLAAGDIDIAEELTPSIVEPLRTASGVQVNVNVTHGSSFGQAVFFNLKKAPFDNVNLRRAIAYAIDYKRLVAVWNGIAVPAQGPFPETFKPWFSAKDAVQYQQDLTKAAAELQRGGLSMPLNPRLKVTVLWQAGQTAQRDMLSLIKEDVAKIGVDFEIVSTEIPQWREAIWKHTFEMAFFQSPLRYQDPDSFMSLSVRSSEYRDQGFNPGITDPSIDALIDAGRATADPAQRLTIYSQLQNKITDQVLFLFLVNKQHAWAQRTNVTGVVWNPNYGPHFKGNEIKKGPAR